MSDPTLWPEAELRAWVAAEAREAARREQLAHCLMGEHSDGGGAIPSLYCIGCGRRLKVSHEA